MLSVFSLNIQPVYLKFFFSLYFVCDDAFVPEFIIKQNIYIFHYVAYNFKENFMLGNGVFKDIVYK